MALNWDNIYAEATDYLQQLLRINTTNPPGNEAAAIELLEGILRKEGFTPTIIETAPGRANLVCRYHSGGTDGPLLLSSHVDVVPAEATKWTHPPFGGVIADDYIWGRGAIDMKSMTIHCLMALLLAKRQQLPCRRDLVMVALADEERGSEYGSAYLVVHHPELLRAEYALNEVGGFTLHINGHRFYPVEVAQKGIVWLRVRATGTPGHGAAPTKDLVTGKIGRAVARLAGHRLPLHVTKPARDFFRAIAPALPLAERLVINGIIGTPFGTQIDRFLPHRRETASMIGMLHNTACPTGMRAGSEHSINVIPSEGEFFIDGRILPGQSQDDFLAEVKALLGPGYEYHVERYLAPTVQEHHAPLFQTIRDVIADADPGAHVVPYLLTGFDDAHFYKKLGITTLGFQPIRCPADFHIFSHYHAHDERIPLQGFHWGVKTFYEVVRRFAS